MTKTSKTKTAGSSPPSNEQVRADVNSIVDAFVKDNPRLEFSDSADMEDLKEAAEKEEQLAEVYRKHLGLLGPN